jgi:hypothetical protein
MNPRVFFQGIYKRSNPHLQQALVYSRKVSSEKTALEELNFQ